MADLKEWLCGEVKAGEKKGPLDFSRALSRGEGQNLQRGTADADDWEVVRRHRLSGIWERKASSTRARMEY